LPLAAGAACEKKSRGSIFLRRTARAASGISVLQKKKIRKSLYVACRWSGMRRNKEGAVTFCGVPLEQQAA